MKECSRCGHGREAHRASVGCVAWSGDSAWARMMICTCEAYVEPPSLMEREKLPCSICGTIMTVDELEQHFPECPGRDR
jgi:hypothetical protein